MSIASSSGTGMSPAWVTGPVWHGVQTTFTWCPAAWSAQPRGTMEYQ
jgi:hypothetical protein